MKTEPPLCEVIVPNLNRRFSGVTATAMAVVPHQMKTRSVCAVGHPFPKGKSTPIPHMGWLAFLKLAGNPLPDGRPRIFHARRNIEMVCGLVLKYLFRRKLHLLFTSTAQREHTRFTRFLYRRMDTLITTCPRAGSFLKRPPAAIVPHGVDTRVYRPAENRAQAWRALGYGGARGVGIFGRVRPQKGVGDFAQALCAVLPKHPDVTAVIVGETTPKFAVFQRDLQEKLAAHGLEKRVVWTGKVPFERIPELFRAMSLVACVSRNEGFGLTCLEAMASGVPVIATQTGGFELVVRPETDGWIIPCGDVAALAAALDGALANPERLDAMGRDARARIEAAFTVEREAAALNAVYARIWANADNGASSAS